MRGFGGLRQILLLTVCGAALVPTSAGAQSASDTYLQTITVTSTRTERTIKDSPRSTYVATRQELDEKPPESVAEMLRDVPGVELVDANVAGMKRLRIRGESSRRVTVLIDGQEITDHSSYGTPILIDPDIIERIDIVRGPSSVIYGTKSIGGVINIITKRGGPNKIGAELSSSYFSGTDGYHGSASVHGTVGRFDYRLFGSKSDHDDRDVAGTEFDPSGTLIPSSFSDDSLFAHFGVRLGERQNHYLQFKADKFKLSDAETWTDPADLGLQPDGSTLAAFDIGLPLRERQKYALFYDVDDIGEVWRKFHIDAYYQTIDRLFSNDITSNTPGGGGTTAITDISLASDDTITNKGVATQFDFTPLNNHYVIAGAQYLGDELDKTLDSDVRGSIVVPGVGTFPTFTALGNEIDVAETKTSSVFIQDEWKFGPGLTITSGMRYYYVKTNLNTSNHEPLTSSDDDELTKSVGVTVDVNEQNTLRALYSEGYVYPTLLQLFVPSSAGGQQVFSNSDLTAERSKNYEIGYRHEGPVFLADVAFFVTTADDYLQTITCASAGNCPAGAAADDFIWRNIDASRAFGVELLGEVAIPDTTLKTYVSGAYTKRRFDYATFSTYNSNTPLWSGRIGLRKDWTLNNGGTAYADLFMRGGSGAEFTDSDGTTDETDGWATLNLNLRATFGPDEKYRLAVNFENLTDESYRPTVDELPGVGRAVIVTAKVKLN